MPSNLFKRDKLMKELASGHYSTRPTSTKTKPKIMIISGDTTGLLDNDEFIGINLSVYQLEKDYQLKLIEQISDYRIPGIPINVHSQKKHGIDKELLTKDGYDDKFFYQSQINQAFKNVDLVLTNDSYFFRKHLEKQFPPAQDKTFLCLKRDIDWFDKGGNSRNLEYLNMKFSGESPKIYEHCDSLQNTNFIKALISKPEYLKELLARSKENKYEIQVLGFDYNNKQLQNQLFTYFNRSWRKTNLSEKEVKSEVEWIRNNTKCKQVAIRFQHPKDSYSERYSKITLFELKRKPEPDINKNIAKSEPSQAPNSALNKSGNTKTPEVKGNQPNPDKGFVYKKPKPKPPKTEVAKPELSMSM